MNMCLLYIYCTLGFTDDFNSWYDRGYIICMLFYFAVDLIGPEKAGFLCELLDEVGRKDLTAIVREYMDKLDRKCYNRTIPTLVRYHTSFENLVQK